jgi:hypothetical protein
MASDLLFTSRQVAFLGAVTVSGTTALEANTNPILTSPFVIQRVLARVTTALTTNPAAMTFKWRPTPGSASGEITLGTFSIPVSSINALFAWDFMRSEGSETVVGAAGALGGYGYGGSIRYEGADLNIVGPGGGFHLVSDGGPGAGAVDFFIEALTLPFSGPVITDRPVTQLNAVVT